MEVSKLDLEQEHLASHVSDDELIDGAKMDISSTKNLEMKNKAFTTGFSRQKPIPIISLKLTNPKVKAELK
jgi:hypothetical protein